MALRSFLLASLSAPFSFSGRASRSEFWGFAPFGLGLCILAVIASRMLGFSFMETVWAIIIALTPLMAVWWRRLQDVGIWGAHALMPVLSFLVFCMAITAAYMLDNAAERGFRQASGHLFSWVFMPEILFKFVGGKWVALICAVIAFIMFLLRLTFSISHAMLPSYSKANKYGPNPNEVTQ